MHAVKIILLAMTCCISYGILHDQVTARICVEYFTIGHAPIFATEDPTWLGLGWGILATWWVGLFLGVPLSIAARCGRLPRLTAIELLRPMIIVMVASATVALASGLIASIAARQGAMRLTGELGVRVPQERHALFLTDLAAHNASYLSGFCGGLVVIGGTWRTRRRRASQGMARA
jgi:hypothetical protein